MDYNTLKNIVYNMPETYEEALQTSGPMISIIQNEILLDNLIKYGIFKDRKDYFNQCKEKYDSIRNDAIKQLEEIEKEDE